MLKVSVTTAKEKRSASYWRTYSFWTGVLAGDVEVDQILAHDDVGDTVTIISHLCR